MVDPGVRSNLGNWPLSAWELENVQSSVPTPPPPPIISRVQSQSAKRIVSEHLNKFSVNSGQEDVKDQLRRLCLLLDTGNDDTCYFSFIRNSIKPVLQDGQTCGLVALSIASQVMCSTPISKERLYEVAVLHHFTKQGEMFSAEDLLCLAKSELHCNGKVIKGTANYRKSELVHHLTENNIVVIPYDRDCNNEPCCSKGQKAHWAVLYGMVFCIKDHHKNELMKHAICDEQINKIYHVRRDQLTVARIKTFVECNDCKVYVLAVQGKSLQSQLWNVDLLLKSNGQLTVPDSTITANAKDYVFKDLDYELNARFIVLFNNLKMC